MTGKVFKVHTSSDKKVGFKEELGYGVSQRGSKCYLTVCLDSNFNLLQGYVLEDTHFVPVEKDTKLKHTRKRRAIYYMMNELSYVCTIIIEKNDKGKVFDNSVILYLPYSLKEDGRVQCKRVSSMLTQEAKVELNNKLMEYALFRLSL